MAHDGDYLDPTGDKIPWGLELLNADPAQTDRLGL